MVTNDPCFIPTWIHQVLYSFQCIFAQCHPLCPQNSEVAYVGLFYVFSFPGSSVQVNSGMWVIFTFYLPFSDRLGWVVGKMAHFQVRKSALMKAWLAQWVTEVAVFSFWAQIWSYSHCSKNTLPVKKKKGVGGMQHIVAQMSVLQLQWDSVEMMKWILQTAVPIRGFPWSLVASVQN